MLRTESARPIYNMAETNTQKLDRILSELAQMRQEMASRSHYDVTVAEHEEFINGNGKPGLKSRIALLEDSVRRTNAIGGVIAAAIILDIVARVLG